MMLSKLRKQIDNIDKKVLDLLNNRAQLSLSIGRIKDKTRSSAYVPNREKEVYEHIKSINRGPLSADTVNAIYREIMSGSLALERPVKISYLGPAATFTHLAAIKKFGSSVKYYPASSITEIFTEVEKGRADYGVVPIENSTEGAINHTLDMFMESDLVICSEILLEISHNLLGLHKIKRTPIIKRIYSNPQVFGQCRMWLESHLPKAELIEVSSTSKAAEIASKKPNSAAIASSLAAECYGLQILAPSIEDSSRNITRFLVIGKTESAPTKKDKTSIMFAVKDKPGVLHDVLAPFKKAGINMTKIESRPSKKKAWEYYFFVDIEGHARSPKISKALSHLKAHTNIFKILGSYPSYN